MDFSHLTKEKLELALAASEEFHKNPGERETVIEGAHMIIDEIGLEGFIILASCAVHKLERALENSIGMAKIMFEAINEQGIMVDFDDEEDYTDA